MTDFIIIVSILTLVVAITIGVAIIGVTWRDDE